MTDNPDNALRAVLGAVLALDDHRLAALRADSGLFGAIPELDSMALAHLFGAIEDRFGIVFADDEIDAAMVETFGSLRDAVVRKIAC